MTGTNLWNVLVTIVSVYVMDKAGRRILLLVPMTLMIVTHSLLTVALNKNIPILAIVMVLLFVAEFAIGLGPIPLAITSELFRDEPRQKAVSVAGTFIWIGTLVVAVCFGPIETAIGEYVFVIFIVFLVGFVLFAFFFVPETKNRSFDDIAAELSGDGVKAPAFDVVKRC